MQRLWQQSLALEQHGGIVARADDQIRRELARLLRQQRDIATRRQRHHAKALGIGAHDVERLAADRAGAAQHRNTVP